MSNIYLVGFMGTGKSVTGRLLAERLNRLFFDMDDLIVKREGLSISEIFAQKGEPYFREIEAGVVRELAQKKKLVVACGGGVFVNDENIRLLKGSGEVICLTSSPQVILKRTQDYTHRPLLNTDDALGKIEQLLAKRMPGYLQAHILIDADQLSVNEAVEEILKQLH